jgi:hypothetical protein
MESIKSSEVLGEAIEFAKKLGHCKGKLYEYKLNGYNEYNGFEIVACCTLGAIEQGRMKLSKQDCDDGLYIEDKAARFVRQHIFGNHVGAIGDDWNDRAETTKEDVIQALSKARELALAVGD